MISMTLRSHGKKAIHKLPAQSSVIVTFRHERKVKGPSAYKKISHELYPGEEPTAIQGTAKCVYWNALKEYYFLKFFEIFTRLLLLIINRNIDFAISYE